MFDFSTRACYRDDKRESKNVFMQKIKMLFASPVMNCLFFFAQKNSNIFILKKNLVIPFFLFSQNASNLGLFAKFVSTFFDKEQF